MATETLRPNGNGTTDLYNSAGNQANNYSYVDEVSANDADYVYNNNSNFTTVWWLDLYALPDTSIPSGSTINKITFYARFNAFDPTTPYAKFAYKSESGGTIYYSSELALTTSFAEYSWIQTTNQKTGLAWTITDINALVAGISLSGYTEDKVLKCGYCSQLWLVIDYTAGAAAGNFFMFF
jgi:hypothetical protein